MPAANHTASTQLLDRFCMAGINYHTADINVRGLFSISKDDFGAIAVKAKEHGIRSVFVLSTCNRTEIYGFAEHVMLLVNLLTGQSKGSTTEFLEFACLKSGPEALDHLYMVASGLDSQILGDYEVLGQLKQAIDTAAAADLIGPIMYRTVNYAFQASKKVKSDTALSSGTVSVSYAAIELLRGLPDIGDKKILVIGAGKFGSNVCKNLKQYLPGAFVAITNRTDSTAREMSEKTGVSFRPFDSLHSSIDEADVLIVCTNAPAPTILPEHIRNNTAKLILDLSVPVNVDPVLKESSHLRIIDVDEISTSILDKTFAKRKADIPAAIAIVHHYQQEFGNWLDEYRYSLHIKSWKGKLQELQEWQPRQYCELAADEQLLSDNKKVQKAVTRLAVNLRTNQEKGCQFINAINDYLQMS